MSDLEREPIPLGFPEEHSVSYFATKHLATYIVTHETRFLVDACNAQKAFNAYHGHEPGRPQVARWLVQATRLVQEELGSSPLPVPPHFEIFSEESWQYVATAYEPRPQVDIQAAA